METSGKKENKLAGVFKVLWQGTNNVPAFFQPDPETDLQNMYLHRYEICPSEPSHVIKGRLSNVFEETSKLLGGEALTKLANSCSTVLGKDTLRCSDYRKATILISLGLKESDADQTMVEVFRTAQRAVVCKCHKTKPRVNPSSSRCHLHSRNIMDSNF